MHGLDDGWHQWPGHIADAHADQLHLRLHFLKQVDPSGYLRKKITPVQTKKMFVQLHISFVRSNRPNNCIYLNGFALKHKGGFAG
ncbi:MAG: hypothetical protein BWY72_01637 [Bacteroidetes bacterium ADurb.Bin416]|nr:MAG: hypothetical protein BWY72_01637 [Bacteroidetes bacterium ADurb.Bin416]